MSDSAEGIAAAIEKVKEKFASNESDPEDDLSIAIETEETTHSSSADGTLIKKNTETRMIEKSNNIIAERFTAREYQGLIPLPPSENHSTDIQMGLYGIPAQYIRYDESVHGQKYG